MIDPKRLHAACRLALAVAREGELAEPRLPAPPGLGPILRFSRLSATAYATITRVVDDDDDFRARVAAAPEATVHEVGHAGYLWLHRPDGWEDDPALHAAPVAGDPDRPTAKAKAENKAEATRRRRDAADAEARRRTKEQLATARRSAAAAAAELEQLRSRIGALEEERNQAMRSRKALEADLADARRDLRMAREATRQAEAELLGAGRTPFAVDTFDRAAIAAAVEAAGRTAADLAAQLATAAGALRPAQPRRPPKPRRRPATRVAPTLPPGIFDGTPEANRHLVASGESTLLVDGYNVARSAWTGLNPEEERRRTIALLEEVRARSKGLVFVVFDGDSATVGPLSSRSVRVVFSPTGVTADDEIARILGELPTAQPVVVVSSDRAVAADARRQGAVAMSSPAFVAAAGR